MEKCFHLHKNTQDTYKGSPWLPWSQNLYVYTGNNPVNYTDPTGHCPWCVAGAVGGGVIGGIAGGWYGYKQNGCLWCSETMTFAGGGALGGAIIGGTMGAGATYVAGLTSAGAPAIAQVAATQAPKWSRGDILHRTSQRGLEMSDRYAANWSAAKNGPLEVVRFAIEKGRIFNDPGGNPNMVAFYHTVFRYDAKTGGRDVAVKVVYDVVNKVIYHSEAYKGPNEVLKVLEKAGEIFAK